jgi:hypothetical protein
MEENYLVSKTTYFVDGHGEWDAGGSELFVVEGECEFKDGQSYCCGDLVDEDDDIRSEDGYTTEVEVYSVKAITEKEYIEMKKIIEDYNKLAF